MKVAIVTDWLTVFGGAEHAILELHRTWPSAPIFTTVANVGRLGPLQDADIRTSKLQKVYQLIGRHEFLLPLLPRAIEKLDLRDFDVILSSSHAVGKGIIPPSTAVHICYCHTPMRYAWEMEDSYLQDFGVPNFLRETIKKILKRIRRWDLSTAKRVDAFIANSNETARRITDIYGRASTVIPPPVDDKFFTGSLTSQHERHGFLAVGRLVPYKRFDLLIEVANALQLPLTIAGRGSEEAKLRKMAGPTVTMLGFVPDEQLPELYGKATALLFPQHEDAGIVPLEAMACGTPVIAYDRGGAKDYVKANETGMFFSEQTPASLKEVLSRFDAGKFHPETLREHARQFGSVRFRERVKEFVETTAKAD
jgi:glycosyltransferase involved in cell wall biosynthesis